MDDRQTYKRRLTILLIAAAVLLAGVVFALTRDTRVTKHGSFTAGVPGRVDSFDGKYFAEQSVTRPEGEKANWVQVTVYDAETRAEVGGFLASNGLAGNDGLEIYVTGNDERMMVCARFDNLGKGASGAAVQSMNIMLGCDEATGLTL